MNNIIALLSGIVACGIAAFAYLYKRDNTKASSVNSVELKVEKLQNLEMIDIVAFFKGLELKKGIDVPFIANAQKIQEFFKISIPNDGTTVMLGTLNEKTDNIENVRILNVQEISKEVLNILGSESLVVLS